MPEQLTGLVVHFNDRAERCETMAVAVGGYVVVLDTVVPSQAVTLTSCYLSSLSQAATAVSHLQLAPGLPDSISQQTLEPLVSQTHARACLLEHAAQLRSLLAELGDDEVAVELDDRLLDAAAVWTQAL